MKPLFYWYNGHKNDYILVFTADTNKFFLVTVTFVSVSAHIWYHNVSLEHMIWDANEMQKMPDFFSFQKVEA